MSLIDVDGDIPKGLTVDEAGKLLTVIEDEIKSQHLIIERCNANISQHQTCIQNLEAQRQYSKESYEMLNDEIVNEDNIVTELNSRISNLKYRLNELESTPVQVKSTAINEEGSDDSDMSGDEDYDMTHFNPSPFQISSPLPDDIRHAKQVLHNIKRHIQKQRMYLYSMNAELHILEDLDKRLSSAQINDQSSTAINAAFDEEEEFLSLEQEQDNPQIHRSLTAASSINPLDPISPFFHPLLHNYNLLPQPFSSSLSSYWRSPSPMLPFLHPGFPQHQALFPTPASTANADKNNNQNNLNSTGMEKGSDNLDPNHHSAAEASSNHVMDSTSSPKNSKSGSINNSINPNNLLLNSQQQAQQQQMFCPVHPSFNSSHPFPQVSLSQQQQHQIMLAAATMALQQQQQRQQHVLSSSSSSDTNNYNNTNNNNATASQQQQQPIHPYMPPLHQFNPIYPHPMHFNPYLGFSLNNATAANSIVTATAQLNEIPGNINDTVENINNEEH